MHDCGRSEVSRIDLTYLPDAVFSGDCSYNAEEEEEETLFMFDSLSTAFDALNICKHVDYANIKRVNTFIYDDSISIQIFRCHLYGDYDYRDEMV